MAEKRKIEFSAQTKEQPFAGVSDDDFMKVEEILNKTIEVIDVKSFENESGPGAYALFVLDGKAKKFLCTHSKPLVAGFERIKKLLDDANENPTEEGYPYVEVKIIKRASRTDAGKQVYAFA